MAKEKELVAGVDFEWVQSKGSNARTRRIFGKKEKAERAAAANAPAKPADKPSARPAKPKSRAESAPPARPARPAKPPAREQLYNRTNSPAKPPATRMGVLRRGSGGGGIGNAGRGPKRK